MDNDIKQVDEKLPDTWELVPFKEVVSVLPDGSKRVKKRNYLETGKIPVIDQGQDYIGGFTDDESMTFTGELPVVLFGDHTKSIKFVKSPFAVGADGIKILKPASSYNIKFFFYLLHSLQIPDRGYSRHFQFLKKFDLPFAPPDEQKRIVAEIERQFSRLDEAVGNLKRVKANLKRYKATVLKAAVEGKLTEEWRKKHPDVEPADKLLERILVERRKKWEEAEFAKMKTKGKVPKDDKWKKKYKELPQVDEMVLPELPGGWTWANFQRLAENIPHALKAGPFGSSLKKSFYAPHGYKIYGQEQVLRNDPTYGDYYIDEERYEKLKNCAVKPGDILISLVGTIGKVLVLPECIAPGIINPRLVKLSLDRRLVDEKYIKIYLHSPYVKYLFSVASHGGTMDILNLTILKEIPIPVPPLIEQNKIAEEVENNFSIIDGIEKEVDKNLKRADRLRQSILKKAFSGKLIPSANDYESGISHELSI